MGLGRGVGDGEDALACRHGRCHRLLQQQVFPRLETADGERFVGIVGDEQIDGIEGARRERAVERAVRRCTEPLGTRGGPVEVQVDGGDDVDRRSAALEAVPMHLGDGAAADEGHPQGARSLLCRAHDVSGCAMRAGWTSNCSV